MRQPIHFGVIPVEATRALAFSLGPARANLAGVRLPLLNRSLYTSKVPIVKNDQERKSSADKFLEEAKAQRSKFLKLIKQQEDLAKRDPVAYKRKVLLLAYGGYAYIFGILFVVLGLIGTIIWIIVATGSLNFAEIKILIFLGVIAFIVLRSLYVKLDPPEGVEITRAEAPSLFREIDAISTSLGAVKADKVILNDELNAFAAQYPRFGIVGPTRNYLCLGLPLLLTLSPDEARSVIAHEFGHFSGQHGRFGGWIYRLNRTWAAIQMNLHHQGSGGWLFQKFFDWFEPLFDATTFALRRQNEYEADAAAVKVAGRDAAASALMRFPFVVPHLQERFWEPLYERAKTEAKPPQHALLGIVEAAKSPLEAGTVEEKLKQALDEKTDYFDTHPALTDRVHAMGLQPENDLESWIEKLSLGTSESAADAFFGTNLQTIVDRVNAHAVKELELGWQIFHEHHKNAVAELAEFVKKRDEAPLTPEEEADYASLQAQVVGKEEGFRAYEQAVRRFPDDARILAGFGQSLLDRDDEQGIEYLLRAKDIRPDFTTAVLETIHTYRLRTGAKEEAERLEEEALQARILDSYVHVQSNQIALHDDFLPHDLGERELQHLQEQLGKLPRLKEAYLVRKVIQANGDRNAYALVLMPTMGIKLDSDYRQKLVNEVSEKVDFGQRCLLWCPNDAGAWAKRLKKVEGSLIYQK